MTGEAGCTMRTRLLQNLREALRGVGARTPDSGSDVPDLLITGRTGGDGAPVGVVEILGPDLEQFAVFDRLEGYKATPMVRSILLLDEERPQALLFVRGKEGGWTSQKARGGNAEVEIPELGVSLALGAVYGGSDRIKPEVP